MVQSEKLFPEARSHIVVALKDFLEEQLAYQDAKYPRDLVCDLSGWHPDETQFPLWTYCCTPHCCEPAEKPPPTTETEVRQRHCSDPAADRAE